MIYKENFKMGLKDIWKNNEINNKAILEYLEDVAGYHSDSIGCGLNSSEHSHLNWILLDWKVKVIKRPKYGQTLEISTWSRKVEKFYAYRDFEIYDEVCNIGKRGNVMVLRSTATSGALMFYGSKADCPYSPDKKYLLGKYYYLEAK